MAIRGRQKKSDYTGLWGNGPTSHCIHYLVCGFDFNIVFQFREVHFGKNVWFNTWFYKLHLFKILVAKTPAKTRWRQPNFFQKKSSPQTSVLCHSDYVRFFKLKLSLEKFLRCGILTDTASASVYPVQEPHRETSVFCVSFTPKPASSGRPVAHHP